MKLLLLLSTLTIAAAAAAAAKFKFREEWDLWKAEHGKSYSEEREELERHVVWLSNRAYIEHHNANANIFGFTLAMNHFGDLTDAEYKKTYLTYSNSSTGNYTAVKIFKPDPYQDYPSSIDWRTKGAVTAVKNQDQCGASYAFSAMGSLEGAWALASGQLNALSEQNIVDCSVAYGNLGCQGGNMYNSFKYVIDNEGVDREEAYPFAGKQYSCNYDMNSRGAGMTGVVQISIGNENHLLAAVASTGPVSVAVDGSSSAFRFYYEGVYDSSRCSSSDINHAMVVTGYGKFNGKDYWLIKNSWGTNWGMSGYILMTRGQYNQCGIATDASYPRL